MQPNATNMQSQIAQAATEIFTLRSLDQKHFYTLSQFSLRQVEYKNVEKNHVTTKNTYDCSVIFMFPAPSVNRWAYAKVTIKNGFIE